MGIGRPRRRFFGLRLRAFFLGGARRFLGGRLFGTAFGFRFFDEVRRLLVGLEGDLFFLRFFGGETAALFFRLFFGGGATTLFRFFFTACELVRFEAFFRALFFRRFVATV